MTYVQCDACRELIEIKSILTPSVKCTGCNNVIDVFPGIGKLILVLAAIIIGIIAFVVIVNLTSRVKCNKCGETIKIKTLFLERAGCENCGNRIEFSKMDQLSGLKQGLLFGTCVFVGLIFFVFMLLSGVSLYELPELFKEMSVEAFGFLLILAMVIVLIVGTLEKVIGCRIYESWRKREEELEKIAEEKRALDAMEEQESNNQ